VSFRSRRDLAQPTRCLVLPGIGEELAQQLGFDAGEGDADRGEPLAPPDLVAALGRALDPVRMPPSSSMTFIGSSSHCVAKIFPPTRNEGRPW
jgi:hypothetical protein